MAGDRRVDERDELDALAVEEVREPAVESLGRQGHVADDRVPIGLEHHPLSPDVGAHGRGIGPIRPHLEPQWVRIRSAQDNRTREREMQKLEGSDDRALVLDGNQLQALRWGAVQNQVPVSELTEGKVLRDDKGKTLGIFGKAEERVRIDFDRVALAIWIPLERQSEAETFVADVNRAIEST